MYRIGSSIKKSNQIRLATIRTTTNVVIRNYCSETSSTQPPPPEQGQETPKPIIKKKKQSREIFSEFVDDGDVVVDHRKHSQKKAVVDQRTQDFDKMLASLTMKDLKLMRYSDNPETFELFSREHFNINDAFEMNLTTKSLLQKQKEKEQKELPGSLFKTQKVIYDNYSQIKSDHIANELNKFKEEFEKPLVSAYNEVINQSNLLYRTKRAEERLIKKRIEKERKEYKLSGLEKHYRDIVQVRNALDFRGKTILAGSDEEDAWQRILERSEITDPHNLSRLHMMDEYNDLGYQTEITEDYINQLSIVPFDFANPASYSSMVNLIDQLVQVDTYRDPEEIASLLVAEKLRAIKKANDQGTEEGKKLSKLLQSQLILELKADRYLETYECTLPELPTPEEIKKFTIDELKELEIVRMAATRLEQYQEAKNRIHILEDNTKQDKIDNYKFYQQMNAPSVANSRDATNLLTVGEMSLKAGTRPSTEDEIIDLLPHDEEVREEHEDDLVDDEKVVATTNEEEPSQEVEESEPVPDIEDPFAINKDFFDKNGRFLLSDKIEAEEQEQEDLIKDDDVAIENVESLITEESVPIAVEESVTTVVEESVTKPPKFLERFAEKGKLPPIRNSNKDSVRQIAESLFNINFDYQEELDEIDGRMDAIDAFHENQEELPLDEREGELDEDIVRPLPSTLPDLKALSAKIRKNEEESLNMIANKYINQEVNEKTATEVLDQIYEAYKTNNLFDKDIIEHDKNTIREANGDVAIPESMYFEYDTTFSDLVDRDVIFKMPLKDTDLVRVLTHQLTETGLLKQEKVLKHNTDDMPVSKELVESNPDAFPDFVKEIIDQNPNDSTDMPITREYIETYDPLIKEFREKMSITKNKDGSVVEEVIEEELIKDENEEEEDEDEEDEGDNKQRVIERSDEVHDEIYDERRLYINLRPQIKDEGVISVPTSTKKITKPIEKDGIDNNDGWLMGKPFNMLNYRLNNQPNKLPMDNVQSEGERVPGEDEPDILVEELADEEDEEFKDLSPSFDQQPKIFEQTDLYYYLQQGKNQEWFRPEKISDKDITSLERRQTWYPRQHIKTYPFEFISSHNTTDQTIEDSWVNRKAVLKVNISAFNLSKTVQDRLAQLTANRYDPQKKVLTLVANNHKTLPENKYEVKRLFKELLHEASLADPNFVSVRTDNYKAPQPQSFVPSQAAKNQTRFNLYRLQGFPLLNNQQRQHMELYSHIRSHLDSTL
ncbi:hypothetical protein DDB_G0279527 [Dictyostelium discoideum AX4]|uniref:Uncharacterized protein DDB_G0279527 n=1 Tax=Dictyostelium discoideum TaxID=44689 RepID=Y7952_DICDI|nr:hypothetical protein DDB_G0279527 [Dictyostelium discoideum AX4]Q54WN8.1 RecName: Full=Uncharacterized protein DDB_G0279527 [Dictyostelium discoideum]EAL67702.1 hypothetical protein DDB_G0279527 [Dictyostelium discoideum AX4]|eukprot:XP_641679.1 hypothetical protein DDB_G0279527 [Dictyostelium discoideum AX4]